MKQDLIVRKAAEIEIAEATVWYEERRPGLGRRFLEALDQAFQDIAERPEAWPAWQPRHPYRKLVLSHFPFAVFYKVEAASVVVVAAAHTSRKPGYWLAREQR